MKFYSKSLRHVALLEVLIAFALVALCVLPLIYPHVFMFQSEKKFVETIEYDHVSSLLFANTLEKLYLNKIDWSDIESEKPIPIDASTLTSIGFTGKMPFTATYRFEKTDHKSSKKTNDAAYIFKVIYSFTPSKGKALEYPFFVAIERRHL